MCHTPGPWIWVNGYLYEAGPYQRYKAWLDSPETPTKYNEDWMPSPDAIVETDSGAYAPRGDDIPLIAAAPDLYEALKLALPFIEEYVQGRTDVAEQMEKALAKAEGRTK